MDVYERLMACPGEGDAFDRHVLACILAKGASEHPRPLSEAVGLAPAELRKMIDALFPGADWLLDGLPPGAHRGVDAIEEPDLRRLLIEHAEHPPGAVARWLSAMVARRSLEPDHLWQDLGLASRKDLSGLLTRHFRALADKNVKDMKWKKFFYREMCADEGIFVCKSPVCEACGDFQICYGPEE